MKMFVNNSFHWRNIVILFNVFEICALPALVPWVFVSLMYQSNILYHFVKPSPYLYSDYALSYVFNALTLFSAISYLGLEFFKRKYNNFVYRQENESIFRMLEYPLLITFNMFFISIPVFTIGSFKVLLSEREYKVAEKKNTSKKIG